MNSIRVTADGRVTTKGAADFIGCSESLLTKQRIAGRGPRYLKIGGRVMYRMSDLEAWVASRAVETDDTRRAA